MTTYKINGDTKQIIRDLRVVNKKVQRAATNRALNDTNRAIHTRVVRGMVASSGVPRRFFVGQTAKTLKSGRERKQIKGIIRKYNSTFKTMKASTWFGLQKKIPVISLVGWGSNKYTKKSLHGKSAQNSFMAVMPDTGHRGIFVRKGRRRLPIQEVVYDFSEYGQDLVEKVGKRLATKTFKRIFTREMKARINRKNSKAYRR
ncbi:MAG: hypothetical protein GY938_18640 [Ketobacter sp.]|nr:hypothetical protein [Ketobacter sp.]